MRRFEAAVAILTCMLAATPSAADNILPNPHFDSTIEPWAPTPEGDVTWSSEDAGGGGSGSLEITPSQPFGAGASVCVPVTGGEFYYIQVDAKLQIEGEGFAKTGIQVFWKADTECKVEIGGLQPFSLTGYAPDWQHLLVNSGAPASAHSAFVQLVAVAMSGNPVITAWLDNPSVGTENTTTTTELITTTTDIPGEPGCADPAMPYDTVTAADALFILRGSVGSLTCNPCYCDTDESGAVGAGDALRVLKRAVGTQIPIECGHDC